MREPWKTQKRGLEERMKGWGLRRGAWGMTWDTAGREEREGRMKTRRRRRRRRRRSRRLN